MTQVKIQGGENGTNENVRGNGTHENKKKMAQMNVQWLKWHKQKCKKNVITENLREKMT